MNEKANHRKILLVGLDNSGKTSIAQSLHGITNLPSFQNMKPTQGVDIRNINAINSEFAIFDLGGQESFRSEHLENFDQYIRGANKLRTRVRGILHSIETKYETPFKTWVGDMDKIAGVERLLQPLY